MNHRIHVCILAIVLVTVVAAPAPAQGDQPNLVQRVLAGAQKKCVKIYGGGIGREHGYATGIIVSGEGHILTAQGVYLAGERIRVATPDGEVHFAKVERRDDGLQIALLKIDATTPDHFELNTTPAAKTGDWVMAVNNAFNVADIEEPLSIHFGIVSMRAELDTKKRAQDSNVAGEVLLVDAITSNPGAAGGALVMVDGRLAGMVGKVLESEATNTRLNYAVPNDLLAQFVAGKTTVVDNGDPKPKGRPELGIRIQRIGSKRAPAYIDRVIADSPAAKAGLKADDLVLEINAEWVRNVRDYDSLFKELRPGDKVVVIVKRGEDIIRASFKAAKAPEIK
jgi:S1-C subfamily serine protease